ncbi:hypothetical protein PHMEG_0008461 [Phytophthora megakarya]|uniref:Uncharacterized protein n=1 Tax=Phytophthora megakarya TaxID=4795 RepID=A0A225WJI3_9STRA|nr:hypothetical protein PHMEG_0008461 [Phytophthora megakarya]
MMKLQCTVLIHNYHKQNSNYSKKENPLRIILRPDATLFLGSFPIIFSNSNDRVHELEKVGFVRRNNLNLCACAALPGPVNAMPIPIADTGSDLTVSSECGWSLWICRIQHAE